MASDRLAPKRAPEKLAPGARVAVLSPSFAAPALFPARHERSLQVLRDRFGLEPVEYPTTRRHDAGPADRAADLLAAFADPTIEAIMATIGGDDQLTVLRYLDGHAAAIGARPIAFFGFSDNTNLLNWLWYHGIASYHGGSTMVHLGRTGGPSPISERSLRTALFERAEVVLNAPREFGEDEIDWSDPASLTTIPPLRPAPEWTWHRPDRVITAPTWGGNLEILHWNLAVGRWIRPAADYAGHVLLLETSQEMPSDLEVFRMLRNMGERGLLAQFPAVLFARARASNFDAPRDLADRAAYRAAQRAAVLRAFGTYTPETMIVFDVDFGHTDPQWVLPYGGVLTIDGPARKIVAHY